MTVTETTTEQDYRVADISLADFGRTEITLAELLQSPGGRAERYVPRPYWLVGAVRALAPALMRRVTTQRSTSNRSSSSSRNG